MKQFILNLLNSDNPTSSKRLVGIFTALSLVIAMIMYHTDALVYSVFGLSACSLGLTTIEKIFKQKEL